VTTLILIRHGETDWIGEKLAGRLPGVHLNGKGVLQAEAVARTLAPLTIDGFYSSPLERARETAEPAVCAARGELRLMDQLQEVDFGELTGKTFKQLRGVPIWKQVHRRPSAVRYPGGESLVEVQRRGISAVEKIIARHPAGLVAVFSHSDTIRLILCHILRMPLDSYVRLAVDPGAISLLQRSPDFEKVFGINLVPGSPILLRET
jgi:broad specificity phosphatase PhoE